MRILSLIYVVGILLISCSNDMPSDQVLDLKLKSKILSGADSLVMSELTDFKWDSLLILTPYSILDSIEIKLNIDLSSIKHTGINYLDHNNVLVYLYEGKVVNMVDFSRYPGDFAQNDAEIEMIPKTKAIFGIMVTNQKVDGKNWIEVPRRR